MLQTRITAIIVLYFIIHSTVIVPNTIAQIKLIISLIDNVKVLINN